MHPAYYTTLWVAALVGAAYGVINYLSEPRRVNLAGAALLAVTLILLLLPEMWPVDLIVKYGWTNYGAYLASLFHRASDVSVLTYTALVAGGWVLAAWPIRIERFRGQKRRARHTARKR